ncbi:Nucleolar protein 13 [Massospora cicadina]|nr:Nucleolar protein 13 [Massospora cicadina]
MEDEPETQKILRAGGSNEETYEAKNEQRRKRCNNSEKPIASKKARREKTEEAMKSNSADEQFDFLEAGFAFAPVEQKNGAAKEDDGLVVIEPKPNKVKLTVDDIAELDRKKELNAKLKQEMTTRSRHGIWIGNLRYTTTADDLKLFFASCGTVTRVNLPVTNSRNKGFAYVDFDTPEAVSRALELSETELEGRNVLIKDAKNFVKDGKKPPAPKAVPGEAQMVPMPSLYVGNLTFETTQNDLHEAFSKYGEIRKVRISTFEDTGRCKGYAWIDFKKQDDATNALRSTQSLKIDDRLVKVVYASEEATLRGHNLPPNHPSLKSKRNLAKKNQTNNPMLHESL